MLKKVLVAAAFSAVAVSAQAGPLLNEGFDDVGTLVSKGWVITNASTPAGMTSGWAQGSEAVFAALKGVGNSYASANYMNAAPGGMLNSWLITPEFSAVQGALVSFWLRADAYDGTSDQISYGFSGGSADIGAFDMANTVTVGTTRWTNYSTRIRTDGNVRFAFQYSGAADLSNYVGLDNLRISEIPEPSTMAILFAGVMGLAMSRRRKRG